MSKTRDQEIQSAEKQERNQRILRGETVHWKDAYREYHDPSKDSVLDLRRPSCDS